MISISIAVGAECIGNPNALGTSRVLVVDPKDHTEIGRMTYKETLPLNDHEVVLTFDDGPKPRHTNLVLDILAAECVKANFFIIGVMAKEFPYLVRRAHAEGHSIGTHTQNHLLKLRRLPIEQARKEIDDGISSVGEVLGDAKNVSPFLRLPGLGFSSEIDEYAASKGIMIWSSDVVADDWRRISSKQIIARAMDRLDQRGRGILLLHDIHARTIAALPLLLRELKRRNYSIVHVVAASADSPKTVSVPAQWLP